MSFQKDEGKNTQVCVMRMIAQVFLSPSGGARINDDADPL